MNIPSRRRLGAIALILAGIAAVGVPLYLWHSTSAQGTSPNPGTTSGNNNGGSTAGNTNPNTNTNKNDKHQNSNPGGPDNTNSCTESKHASHDSDPSGKTSTTGKDNGKHNGNAYGLIAKQMDTTVAFVKSLGTHNSAFHQHHDTKTDNDTVQDPQGAGHDSNDHDSSCSSAEESNEQD